MNLTAVSSSNLAAVGYDKSTSTLRVLFQTGTMYDYSNVPAELHNKLMQSESKGEFFKDHVREQFQFEKVNPIKERNQMGKNKAQVAAEARAKSVQSVQHVAEPVAVAEEPKPETAQAPATPAATQPESKQMVTIMKLTVALRQKRQIEVKPEMLKQDGKFINLIVGPEWPTIRVGNSGGITVMELRSYGSAFDAAVDGDTLLAKQKARDTKKVPQTAPAAQPATAQPAPASQPVAKETPAAKKGKQHEAVEQQLQQQSA